MKLFAPKSAVDRSSIGLKFCLLLVMAGACTTLVLYEKRLPHTHTFDHKLHTTEVGLQCQFCHYAVPQDGVEPYGMLPKMADCLMCHQEKFDNNQCQFCHRTEEPGPLNLPAHDHISYSHQQHMGLENWENACLDCHAGAHENTKAVQDQLPPMQKCLDCHQEWYDDLDCLNCHKDFSQIPLEPRSEFSHVGNFTETHGPTARAQTNLCFACHDQPFCAECHNRERLALPPDLRSPDETQRHFAHESGFLTRHFIEARFNSAQCITCHSQAFCRDCHVREGIADQFRHVGTDLAADPHPQGFDNPVSPNFHGRIARREILTCASCHDNGADTICLECHATFERGGNNVNPHPFGFSSSLRRNADPVCLRCHVRR